MVSPTTDRRFGLSGNTAYKAAATVAATGNITQSGEQTIDGVAVKASNAAGVADRVLCTGMTDATKNGLWDVNTGAWTRSVDANGNYDLAQGTQVYVAQGSTGGGLIWVLTTANPITIGTTALSFSQNLSVAFLATIALATGSTLMGWIQAAVGAVLRTISDKLRDEVHLFDFLTAAQKADAVSGAQTLDLTVPIQAWLTHCGTNNKKAKGAGLCKITGALTLSGDGGIDWETVGYDNSTANGGLVVSGTGYVALTITGRPTRVNVALFGTGNVADGLYMNNPVLMKEANIRVMNLSGFGLKIDQCFDCVFNSYSIQQCGAAGKPAFSVNDGAGTSNESWFGRGQVELTNADCQAVFISGNTVNCTFETIHSERATATAPMTMWSLGGRCTYKNVRLNASGTSANAKAFLNGINAQYVGLTAEGNIPVTVDCSGGASNLVGCTIAGTYTENAGQTGRVTFSGGSIAALAGGAQVGNTRYFNTLLAGAIPGGATAYTPAFTSTGTAFAIGNGTITGRYWLLGSDQKLCKALITVTFGGTTTFGTGTYRASLPFASENNGLQSRGGIEINNSGVQIDSGDARVQPNASIVEFYTGSIPATLVGSTAPHTFKANDYIAVDVTYPIA